MDMAHEIDDLRPPYRLHHRGPSGESQHPVCYGLSEAQAEALVGAHNAALTPPAEEKP